MFTVNRLGDPTTRDEPHDTLTGPHGARERELSIHECSLLRPATDESDRRCRPNAHKCMLYLKVTKLVCAPNSARMLAVPWFWTRGEGRDHRTCPH